MHSALIHKEFSKIAGHWDKMTREDQEAYLKRHKKSKRRLTATPKTKRDKLTFKTEKSTGKFRSFFEPTHHIKINGNSVGTISDAAPHKIRLMVVKQDPMEDNNPNCAWKWIQLQKESQSLDEAKAWLATALSAIQAKFKLASLKD